MFGRAFPIDSNRSSPGRRWARAFLASLMVAVMLGSAISMPAWSVHASMDDHAMGCAMDEASNDGTDAAGVPANGLEHGFGHCCPLPMLGQLADRHFWAGVAYPVSDVMAVENQLGGIASAPPYKPPRLIS